MAYTSLPNPWKNIPYVGPLIDAIQDFLTALTLTAADVSILDTANDFTATDVEGALAELQSDNEIHAAASDPHAGYVLESLFDANTVLKADSDNTPAALTMAASTTLARLASGSIVAATVTEMQTLLGIGLVGYGTSLPGSPTGGQEYILVDSTTAPTYQWRFRYNSGSSGSYKWEFVGGTPKYSTEGDIISNSVSYAVANSPAAITAPVAGEYLVGVQGNGYIQNNAAQSVNNYLGVRVNAVDPTDDDCKSVFTWTNQSNIRGFGDGGEMKLSKTLAASDSLQLAYRTSVTTNTSQGWKNARLFLYPLRVS